MWPESVVWLTSSPFCHYLYGHHSSLVWDGNSLKKKKKKKKLRMACYGPTFVVSVSISSALFCKARIIKQNASTVQCGEMEHGFTTFPFIFERKLHWTAKVFFSFGLGGRTMRTRTFHVRMTKFYQGWLYINRGTFQSFCLQQKWGAL